MKTECEKCVIRDLNSLQSVQGDELKYVTKAKTTLHIKKGEVIFSEGASLKGVYCLRNGKCKLTKLAPNGKEQIVRFISKGELVGHRSVISNSVAHLTVTALEEMDVCFIPKHEILELFKKNSEFSMGITKSLAEDLDEANASIANMAQKNVRERLAESLLFFEKIFGVDNDGFIAVSLTREEIANAIGTATESTIRLLSGFKKEGYILLSGKKIKLMNKIKLQHLTEGY
ncbi:MAG: cyclic nucleotide-binding domain-containing protein [Flavobacteriaceae bacterium]|nr:cyclic nucleotide-binding domain-containing protein [Flavobacteriaceae bacterium]